MKFNIKMEIELLSHDDILVFAEEKDLSEEKKKGIWNILIVDDEPQVHQVTRMVLRDLEYNNKKLNFISAFSAAEARVILSKNNDISLALLDVVMEKDSSGLELVEYIREDLNDQRIRIILRTGQPGFAPEKEVIINYDINDYKEKTELSAQKLFTSIISALRNYEYINEISVLNNVLEQRVADRVSDLNKTNKKLQCTLDSLQEDQEAGRKMQNKLLPDPVKKIQNYVFSRHLFPSMTLSGDFIDYFEINEQYVGFYIADVSGHGVSSAIVTVLLKNFVDNALEKFWLEGNPMILKPEAVCKRLNEELIRENFGKYLTMFYGIIDTGTNRLYYTNCGQFPYPFFSDGKRTVAITDKGTPVGLFRSPIFRANEIELPEKFSMMIISDGILEILNQKTTEDKTSFLHSLLEHEKGDIDTIVNIIGLDNRSSFPDDVTFLMIKKEVGNG